jgi:hypothetical protein
MPTLESPPVVGKTGSEQTADPGSSSIPGSPGEQLSSTIARKHAINGHSMDRSDGLPQGALVTIGVIAKGSLTQTRTTGRPGSQGGTGIKQLRWPTAQHIRDRLSVAAMAQVDAHPESRYNAMTSPA